MPDLDVTATNGYEVGLAENDVFDHVLPSNERSLLSPNIHDRSLIGKGAQKS
jgi:hypothetical protein